MALYLSHFSYSPAAWGRLMNNPEDRSEVARKAVETAGGKLHGFWYAFSDYDGCMLWEAKDSVAMAAVAIAVNAGGALTKFETTHLVTVDEAMAAFRKAQSVSYRPPGAK